MTDRREKRVADAFGGPSPEVCLFASKSPTTLAPPPPRQMPSSIACRRLRRHNLRMLLLRLRALCSCSRCKAAIGLTYRVARRSSAPCKVAQTLVLFDRCPRPTRSIHQHRPDRLAYPHLPAFCLPSSSHTRERGAKQVVLSASHASGLLQFGSKLRCSHTAWRSAKRRLQILSPVEPSHTAT